MAKETVTLSDGISVKYDPEVIGEGAMKDVCFTTDKSSVVCFFKDNATATDPQRMSRLEAVLGKYNPTTDPKTGDYFKKLFCWPSGIILKPRLGILAPTYPSNYFFASGPWKGKEKKGNWFVRSTPSGKYFRDMLPEAERGSWVNYFKICILLARAIRRLHQAGLAHSDLSCNNVLIDPSTGQCIVIDIDSLVVPGIFPPDVLGTPGYIAPEVLATLRLPLNDPKRKHPSSLTDQHALGVLLYEYLIQRHPLKGPQTFPASSGEEQEMLEMGSKALYIEHPTDQANRPKNLTLTSSALGTILADLFRRTFIEGLHEPNKRPTASEWEKGLVKTWDMLHPCSNPKCSSKWLIIEDQKSLKCHFCNTRHSGDIPVIKFRREGQGSSGQGKWYPDGQLVVYHNLGFYKWHVYDNIFPGELADRTRQGYFLFHQGQWLLVNENMNSLLSPSGKPVPPGQAIALKDGLQFRMAQENHGRVAEIQILK